MGHPGTAEPALVELSVTSVLADQLDRLVPLAIHRAVLAGASLTDLVEAAALGPEDLYKQWCRWADGQRRLYEETGLGLPKAEYREVVYRLTVAVAEASVLDGRTPQGGAE